MVETVVLLLALLAVFTVPLGTRTTWQHLVAIFSTPEAASFGRELQGATTRVVNEVQNTVSGELPSGTARRLPLPEGPKAPATP